MPHIHKFADGTTTGPDKERSANYHDHKADRRTTSLAHNGPGHTHSLGGLVSGGPEAVN